MTAEALFEEIWSRSGPCYRHTANRQTLAINCWGQPCVVKKHSPVPWATRCLSGWLGRTPWVDASQEWINLQRMGAQGVRVPEPLAYGVWGGSQSRSWVVMRRIDHHTDVVGWWRAARPYTQRRACLRAVAETVANIHQAGFQHRDLYLCHVWLPTTCAHPSADDLCVIDWHRARQHKRLPSALRIKELGALLFSTRPDLTLTRGDYRCFILHYQHCTGQQWPSWWWRRVYRRAQCLWRRHGMDAGPLW